MFYGEFCEIFNNFFYRAPLAAASEWAKQSTYVNPGWVDVFRTPQIEAATRDVLQKKLFFEILQNSQENTCARVSFLIKLQAWGNTFLQNTSGRLFLSALLFASQL